MQDDNISAAAEAEAQGWGTLLRGRQGIYCLSLTAGIVLYAIILPISYTVLPAIIRELRAELYYSWVAMLFSLGSLIGACLLGHILRLMQPHIAYILALALFALCTLACAYAPSLPFLLAARAAQGVGGGLLVALTYNMLSAALPKRLLPRGIGLISGMWGIATLIGPYLGGSFENWRIPFFAVSAAAALFCVYVFIVFGRLSAALPKDAHRPLPAPWLPIFILTALVLIISIGGVPETLETAANAALAALHLSVRLHITPLATGISGLLIGFMLLLWLGHREKRSAKKLLPSGSFKIGSIFFLIYAIIILNMVALGGTKLYLPLFLQDLHHATPISAGYIAFTDSIGWTLGALIGAGLNATLPPLGLKPRFHKTHRFGRNMAFVLAPLLCLISMGGVAWLMPPASNSGGILLLIGVSFFITGFFSGIMWPHILALILQNAKTEEKEAADSSLCIVQFFAPALADCLAGALVNATGFKADNLASMSHAAAVLFAFCTGILLLVFLLCLKVRHYRPSAMQNSI